MPDSPLPERAAAATGPAELPFLTLWYRFLFFDWMFRDINTARNLYERHAAWQHNRHMRRYLPTYLRRWTSLSMAGFALGCLFERASESTFLTAWCFTWSCVAFSGMVVISVAWAFLARSR